MIYESLMAYGSLFHRVVLKATDVSAICWLVEDVSLVIVTTMLILVTLTPENVGSVIISPLCRHAQFCSNNLFIMLFFEK